MTATANRVTVPGLFLLVLVGGCQPGRGSLEGSVTCQAKQVVLGMVSLHAAGGVPRFAEIAADGTYRFDDVPAGEVRLAVVSPDPAKITPARDENGKLLSGPKVDRSKWVPLPDAAGDPRTSGISTTVRPGPNAFDIELK